MLIQTLVSDLTLFQRQYKGFVQKIFPSKLYIDSKWRVGTEINKDLFQQDNVISFTVIMKTYHKINA